MIYLSEEFAIRARKKYVKCIENSRVYKVFLYINILLKIVNYILLYNYKQEHRFSSDTMPYVNQQNQDSKYGQLAHRLLKIASISGSKVVLRNAGKPIDTSTQLVHEIGTTDVAIGDATAEVMITTLGEIPNEMYFPEDTPMNMKFTTANSNMLKTSQFAYAMAASTETSKSNTEHSGHSSVLFALLAALGIILLLCCITACLITKSKKKNSFFGKGDMECRSGCKGLNQPLLDKVSDSSNKTSMSSLRNYNN